MRSGGSWPATAAIGVMAAAGIAPALLPVVFFLGRPSWAWWCLGAGTLFTFLLLWRQPIPRLSGTSPAAAPLSALGFIFPMSLLAMFWLLVYAAAYGLLWVVDKGLPLVGGGHLDPAAAARWASLVVPVTVGWAFIQTGLKRIRGQLAPGSQFRRITDRYGPWLAASSLLGLAILAVLYSGIFGSPSHYGWLLVAWGTLAAAAFLWNLGGIPTPAKPSCITKDQAVETVRGILSGESWGVQVLAGEGEDGGNPLLTNVDLFAWREREAFAIAVQAGPEAENPVTWKSAAGMPAAASEAMQRLEWSESASIATVGYVMVLAGAVPDSTLREYASRQNIRLVEIAEEAVQRLTGAGGEAGLHGAAERYFPMLLPGGDLSAPGKGMAGGAS
jgi:hypothetical protein